MKTLDQLHNLHDEATNLFDHTENVDAKNEVAQCLCSIKAALFVLEAGGQMPEWEITMVIDHAHKKIAAAIGLLEPVPDTERSL